MHIHIKSAIIGSEVKKQVVEEVYMRTDTLINKLKELGFIKGSTHIRMNFKNFVDERKVMLVRTLDELSQYDERGLETYVVKGKENHKIKIQITNIFNDVI